MANAHLENSITAAEWFCGSEAETREAGRQLAASLRGGEVLSLEGPLGAGKTTFVKGLAEGLGCRPEEVSSPTFTLVHEYPDGRLPFVHLDLYRLDEERLAALDRMGAKSARNLIAGIDRSRRIGLARLIFALGIRHVGEKTAQDLARHELGSRTSDEVNQLFQTCRRVRGADLNRIHSKRTLSQLARKGRDQHPSRRMQPRTNLAAFPGELAR